CRDILHMDLPGATALQFDITLHVATVLSTIVVLWHEFVPLIKSFFGFKNDANTTYVFKLLVSAIPIMIVGLFFKDKIEALFDGNLTVVGCALLITAALLTFAYLFRAKPEQEANLIQGEPNPWRRGRDITFIDAFIIGLSQAMAVIPGLSRSGTTIATGLMLGDRRDRVAQFSFFMVIIPILGEALLDVKDMIAGSGDAAAAEVSVGLLPLVIGFISAFVVGCIACKWMLNIVKRGKLYWFAVYCVIMGLICIFFK
ncbi:MAG: undecaprenyl-diphosphate phosphatase, partial [Muribaculaceae bacterium]|nr:undecaprenyl-diphosphate phosphatase [Muribaculaceae bacterium]